MAASSSQPKRQPVIEVVDPAVAAILRGKTGVERLKIAHDMFVGGEMLLSHLRSEHPDWDQPRLQEEVARRISHRAP